jgi:RHS repeat-associated protein
MYSPPLGAFLSKDPLIADPMILNDNNWFGAALSAMKNAYRYGDNNPVNSTDPSGLACRCGEALECLLRAGPSACIAADSCGSSAHKLSRATGLPGPRNGPQDAVRHCILSCCISAKAGPKLAKIILDLHEECVPNPPDETQMDKTNNAIGTMIGTKFYDDPTKLNRITPPADIPGACLQICLDALKKDILMPKLPPIK